MKWIILFGMVIWSSIAFAIPPVTLSGPSPAISQTYSADTTTTVIYTLTNNVPKALPLTISGISNGVTRTQVTNDCGDTLSAGPSTCNLGIMFSPSVDQIGTTVNQTLRINYQGRTPLTSQISFAISQSAYVTSVLTSTVPTLNQISQFTVNVENGLFDASTLLESSSTQQYTGLAFATVGNVQYAYVTNQSAAVVYQCTINSSGGFDSCVSALSVNPGWNPHGIAFTTVNGSQYGYVTDADGYVYQCTLNLNGSFNSCTVLTPTFPPSYVFSAPYGISFAVVNGLQYAYVADASGYLFQCALDLTGAFTTCAPTPANNAPNWIPYYAIIKTISDTQYAYVANNGGGSSASPAVYKCQLQSDGSLYGCTTTPLNPPTINWSPVYIAFTTLSGIQYAYIACVNGASGGAMYRCTIDNAGEFQDCEATGITTFSSWFPYSVAFRF